MIGRRRIVRRIRADADTRGLRTRKCARRACAGSRPRTRRSSRGRAPTATARRGSRRRRWRETAARRLAGIRLSGDSCSGEPCSAYIAPSSVWLYSSRPRFMQDRHRRFAARRRAEQQQQAAAHIGAGCGRLEVIDDTAERSSIPNSFAFEELLGTGAAVAVRAVARPQPAKACPTGIRDSCAPVGGHCRVRPCAGTRRTSLTSVERGGIGYTRSRPQRSSRRAVRCRCVASSELGLSDCIEPPLQL